MNPMRNRYGKALVFTAVMAALATGPAEARSNAAQWLVDREIAEACDGNPGSIDPSGAIERDLDGDGRDDFLLAHEAITCQGDMARSLFCGMQVCTVKIFLRRGDLLEQAVDMLGGGVEVGAGPVPAISMYAHGGARGQLRWNGRAFE
jgi:hypothetical protein